MSWADFNEDAFDKRLLSFILKLGAQMKIIASVCVDV